MNPHINSQICSTLRLSRSQCFMISVASDMCG